VFVADRTTLRALRSSAWHPPLEEALRRHIRRSFYLDVLLVLDYDTMPAQRTGQRHRRLAKAAGLVDSPLEATPSAREPIRTDGTAQNEAAPGRKAAAPGGGHTAAGISDSWKPISNSGA
jgi:hypothetical protein